MSVRSQFIILAAGEGTRMKSDRPKVLHEIGGLSLLGHVIELAQAAQATRISVVHGPDGQAIRDGLGSLADGVLFHTQAERLGTAHAVLAARSALVDPSDVVFVLFADTPLLTVQTVENAVDCLAAGNDVAVVGFVTEKPGGYGRLVEDGGALLAIVEDKDATEEQKRIKTCNSGIMAFRGSVILPLLEAIGTDNAQGEYYLTDAVAIAKQRGSAVAAILADENEVLGVNTRTQLARCEAVFQTRKRTASMEAGVTLEAPETVYFSHDTELAADVRVEPQVYFGRGVTVEAGANIRAFSHLEGAHIGPNSTVGPFARIRPGSHIGPNAKVGNFVETKNAAIASGAKVNHLSYVGDATVGEHANIGAGTITCNYDGVQKYKTVIKDGAFIGSNSALVAPVTIGNDAYVASGSVITDDVPDQALAIGRGRQVNKPDRAPTGPKGKQRDD